MHLLPQEAAVNCRRPSWAGGRLSPLPPMLQEFICRNLSPRVVVVEGAFVRDRVGQ